MSLPQHLSTSVPPSDQLLAHRVAIALGSNLSTDQGTPQTLLELALKSLNQTPGIQVIRHSPWYETAAVGPPQPNYLNGCALLAVTLPPLDLMQQLLATEAEFGRVRRERWGPRSLDLDLLLYDDWVLQTPTLEIPHPRMRERAFVLVPLADIAPAWIDPISGQAIADLVKAVDCSGIKRVLPPPAATELP